MPSIQPCPFSDDCQVSYNTAMFRLLVSVSVVVSLTLVVSVTATRAVQERFIFFGSGEDRLEKYNVDKTKISVSGISSGAAMATQFHVIFSKHIMGAGLIAGVPYGCSGGNLAGATLCMKTPALESLTLIEALTAGGATTHTIDQTSYLANDRVYIFSGTVDSVVNPGNGPKIKSFYSHYIHNPSNIKTVFNIAAEHGQPTDRYGGACNHLVKTDFINNCNYSAAYDLLNHIYGGSLAKPSLDTVASGVLKKIDQTAFVHFSSPALYSMDDVGYIYIPTRCQDKTNQCKLHIAFHGCKAGQSTIGDHYVRRAGYNEVAELNDIIILYPQVIATLTNMMGCWDWYGYTGLTFESHLGFQPTMLKRMMDRVTG